MVDGRVFRSQSTKVELDPPFARLNNKLANNNKAHINNLLGDLLSS